MKPLTMAVAVFLIVLSSSAFAQTGAKGSVIPVQADPASNWTAFQQGNDRFEGCHSGQLETIMSCHTALSMEQRKSDWRLFGIEYAYWRMLARLEDYVPPERYSIYFYRLITLEAFKSMELIRLDLLVKIPDICTNLNLDKLIANPNRPGVTQCDLLNTAYDEWTKKESESH